MSVFCDGFVVCRMGLSPTDVSSVISVATELVGIICTSFDGDDTETCCEDNTVAHHTIQRNVEVLTEYLRLLRNACADCPCHQSIIQTLVTRYDLAVHRRQLW